MTSTKKVRYYDSASFSGPRRQKPKVRELNRAVRERIEREHGLAQRIVGDMDLRRAVAEARGIYEPHLVWHDFDHATANMTEVQPSELPRWRDIGEYLKMHILFQAILEFGGYSFTVRVRPDLQAKWQAEARDPVKRINHLVDEGIRKRGLTGLEFAYVIENRTKKGHKTPLHIHGFLMAARPITATRFKMAVEKGLATHVKGKTAAGFKAKARRATKIEPSYDVIDSSARGRGRWATYCMKNAAKRNNGLERSIYISREGRRLARIVWEVLRGDRLTEY